MPINSDENELQNVSNSFNGATDNIKGFKRWGNAMVQAITNKRKQINNPIDPDESPENNQGVE